MDRKNNLVNFTVFFFGVFILLEWSYIYLFSKKRLTCANIANDIVRQV